jgi:uncharacterized protein
LNRRTFGSSEETLPSGTENIYKISFENQPYVVPLHFAYDGDYLYVFSTFGQKVTWMRANSKVCVQRDEIQSQSEWISVIA